MLVAMQTAAMNTWPAAWHSHSTRMRLWALCCATGFTGLVLMLFMPDRRHVAYDTLPPPVVLSVRLLADGLDQTRGPAPLSDLASRLPKTASRGAQTDAIEGRAIRVLQAPQTAPQVAPITPTQPLPGHAEAPAGSNTAATPGAPLDLSTQTTGRALESVRPGGSLSEAARQQHGLAGPHERERWSDAVSRSAKPDCLAGNPQGSLLDLPVRLLQALRDQCK